MARSERSMSHSALSCFSSSVSSLGGSLFQLFGHTGLAWVTSGDRSGSSCCAWGRTFGIQVELGMLAVSVHPCILESRCSSCSDNSFHESESFPTYQVCDSTPFQGSGRSVLQRMPTSIRLHVIQLQR